MAMVIFRLSNKAGDHFHQTVVEKSDILDRIQSSTLSKMQIG